MLGAAFGLFAAGYWLSDVLPVGSRLLALLTGLLAVGGAAACYLLLRWARCPFLRLSGLQQVALLGVSAAAGAALLFGGTSQWRSAAKYLPFFLPEHHVRISVVSGQTPSVLNGDFRILWFSTSLGDVSYGTLQLKGWKRVGDELMLEDPSSNSVEWKGRTGGNAELVFRGSGGDQKLLLSWDAVRETIDPGAGKFTYQKALAVPWYASRMLVLILGIISFAFLSSAVLLLLWENRAALRIGMGDFPLAAGYRLERADGALILAAILVALLLRLPNLGTLFPAVDEYYHLIAARQITEGAALSSVYARGLWIVTVPVSLSLRVFGYELWAARLVGVLFNAMAIVPLYLLARTMNRAIAGLSVGLFATSPWIVTFARIAREYAYYPFYFYWILLAMVSFIRLIPQGTVLPRDWKGVFTPRLILLGVLLAIPPLFALYGDRLSTFRTILLAYPIFGLFALSRFDLKHRSNWMFLALLGAGLFVASYRLYERQKTKIVPFPRYNSIPIEYFLPNPTQQWYFGRLVLLIVAGLLVTAVACYLIRRRNFIPLFILTLFASSLVFFALFSMTFFHTRHLTTTELWYVIVVAMGLYFIWKMISMLSPWKGRLASISLLVVLGLAVINVPQVTLPTISTNPDDPISEDYLHDLTQVQAFMLDHVQPGDVLISTVYGLYSLWKEEPQFEAQYRINTQTPREEVIALIDQHQSGWIVIDRIRLEMSPLGQREFAGIPGLRFVGSFGDEYVWQWHRLPVGFESSVVAGKGQWISH